jgi:hypothetical protein
MTRPLYESSGDRCREQEVAKLVEERWRVVAQKMPMRYEFDYMLMRPEPSRQVAIMEVKCRNAKYDTLIISMQKVVTMQTYHQQFGVPAVLAVSWPDEEPKYTLLEPARTSKYIVEWGGRDDRGDDQDKEPVIHIPVEHFRHFRSATREEPA